ncbi:MAG TPA: YitT family protein [Clostridiaceae bacterium]|jgi:uncharacterized membrane-anchored protein YitT (DUF2179 family)|nr:YitT family protein [Clostridiaceae bacterium]
MKFSKDKLLKLITEYFFLTIGSFLTAAAINVFLVPNKIVSGGLSGVSTVIYYLSNGLFPVGATMFVLNVPLFIGGFKLIGKKFIVRTLYSAVALSFFIDYTASMARSFIENYLVKIESAPTQPDLLLYSIFGGLIMGFGLGIVIKFNATTGGSDLLARIINRLIPAFTIGQVLLFIDILVVLLAAVVFKSVLFALYAVVTLVISSKVIDALIEGVSFAKAVFIISDNSDKIALKIMEVLDRGVTSLKGTGMYTRHDKEVLLCVLHRRQIPGLKELVKEIDPKAFIVLTDVREVLGEGFKAHE